MDILWDELDKEQQPSINQKVAAAFMAVQRHPGGPRDVQEIGGKPIAKSHQSYFERMNAVTPTTLKGTIAHMNDGDGHNQNHSTLIEILREANIEQPLTMPSLQDKLAEVRQKVIAKHAELHANHMVNHSHPVLGARSASAEEDAQNKEHQPAYVHDNGTYHATCTCGFQTEKVNKHTVAIDEDYTNPENDFGPEEISLARDDAASKATRAEFGEHARDFQRDESLTDLSDVVDIRHTNAIQDEFSQRDLADLLAETQGRPSGQSPIEDAERKEPLPRAQDNSGIYQDRSKIPTRRNLRTEVERSVNKLKDYYETSGGEGNLSTEEALRRTRSPLQNLALDIDSDPAGPAKSPEESTPYAGKTPPDTPNRLPLGIEETIKPSKRKK